MNFLRFFELIKNFRNQRSSHDENGTYSLLNVRIRKFLIQHNRSYKQLIDVI